MNASRQAAAIMALEAATDVLIVALSRRPEPDLEAATNALKARGAALSLLVGSDPKTRPPDMNKRLRRILDTDRAAADHMRTEMESLRQRLAGTRQMMHKAEHPGRVGEPVR